MSSIRSLKEEMSSDEEIGEKEASDAGQVIPPNMATDGRNCVDLFALQKGICKLCINKKLDGRFGDNSVGAHETRMTKEELALAEKTRDKEMADCGERHALAFDRMQVQTCPWMTKPNISYYKMKLLVHSYTVYNLSSQDAKVYWFDESNGVPEASAAASCLHDYISELLSTDYRNPVVVYSDGCARQNRNSTMSNALRRSSILNRVTIVQKFLEEGQPVTECDAVQSHVERTWRDCDVYVPTEFVEKTLTAPDHPAPYRAELLDYTFFGDFRRNKVYRSIRPGTAGQPGKVDDIRAIKYTPDGQMFYQLDFYDRFKRMTCRPEANNSTQQNSTWQFPADTQQNSTWTFPGVLSVLS